MAAAAKAPRAAAQVDPRIWQESVVREQRAKKQWELLHGAIYAKEGAGSPERAPKQSPCAPLQTSQVIGRVVYGADDTEPQTAQSRGRRDYDRPWLACSGMAERVYATRRIEGPKHRDSLASVMSMGHRPASLLDLSSRFPRRASVEPLIAPATVAESTTDLRATQNNAQAHSSSPTSPYRVAKVTQLEGRAPFRRQRSDFNPLMQH